MPYNFTADDLIDQLERWYLTSDDYNQLNDLMCKLAKAHYDAGDVPEDHGFLRPVPLEKN